MLCRSTPIKYQVLWGWIQSIQLVIFYIVDSITRGGLKEKIVLRECEP